MPVAPEFAYRQGKIGSIEIFGQTYSQKHRRAHRYRGITGKVAVNLYGKKHSGDDEVISSVFCVIPIDRVDKNRNPVRYDKLQKEAPQHQQKALARHVVIKFLRRGKLSEQVLGALDGTGDQLGKKRHKERVSKEIFLGVYLIAVNVHRIAERLKGVE